MELELHHEMLLNSGDLWKGPPQHPRHDGGKNETEEFQPGVEKFLQFFKFTPGYCLGEKK